MLEEQVIKYQICAKCKEEKVLGLFARNNRCLSKHDSTCKACRTKKRKEM